jgi:hypothetical protein
MLEELKMEHLHFQHYWLSLEYLVQGVLIHHPEQAVLLSV